MSPATGAVVLPLAACSRSSGPVASGASRAGRVEEISMRTGRTRRRRITAVAMTTTLVGAAACVAVAVPSTAQAASTAQVYWSSESTNSSYPPENGNWYTSPATGLASTPYQLAKQNDVAVTTATGNTTITVDTTTQYQTLLGVGSSLEESSIYNLWRMSSTARTALINKLFNPSTGSGFDVVRITFGTPDFTSHAFYTYDDGAADTSLSRFSISQDLNYHVIDVLKAVLAVNPNVKFFASSWTAPAWMKTNNSLIGGSLNSTYIPQLATYYRKAVQAYAAQGVPIYGMTLQNEPEYAAPDYPSMLVTASQEQTLATDLRTEFANNGLSATKIWAFDHNFSDGAAYAGGVLGGPYAHSSAYSSVDGVAFHDYGGNPSAMTTVHNAYPDKDVMMTERAVWGTAGADRIVAYLRNWSTMYEDWVTMLDQNRSPERWSGSPDPTMLVQSVGTPDTYWATPEFNIISQFSKFLKPGAKRVASNYGSTGTVTDVAFVNPDGSLVVVVVNQTTASQPFSIGVGTQQIASTLPAKTVGTYVWAGASSAGGGANVLANPGFESGTAGWTDWHNTSVTNMKADTDAPRGGAQKLTFYNSAAYQQLTGQTVNVPNGHFTVSVWVRSGGGFNTLRLYAKNYGGAELDADAGSDTVFGWTKYEIPDVPVTNGTLTLGAWADANAGNWVGFDDFSATRIR
jgi:glucosylceramidase